MSERKRRLKQPQIIKLSQWMHTNRSRIVGSGLRILEVASLATKELEFEISDSSVRQVATTLAIKLAGMHIGKPPRKSRVRVVARELVHLLERLGEPVADDLQDVVDNF